MAFGAQKLKWLAIRRWKKSEDTITCFDRIHERDRQTDRQTDGQSSHDGISRGKILETLLGIPVYVRTFIVRGSYAMFTSMN